jgi:hypothetical protein
MMHKLQKLKVLKWKEESISFFSEKSFFSVESSLQLVYFENGRNKKMQLRGRCSQYKLDTTATEKREKIKSGNEKNVKSQILI